VLESGAEGCVGWRGETGVTRYLLDRNNPKAILKSISFSLFALYGTRGGAESHSPASAQAGPIWHPALAPRALAPTWAARKD